MYIVGASGHAKVVIDALELSGGQVCGVLDKNEMLSSCLGHEVSLRSQFLPSLDKTLFIAIGCNQTREKIVMEYLGRVEWGTIVHPAAILSKHCKLGKGTIIMAGAVVQADCMIGNHSIVNTKASIDHDCIIGDFVHIAPRATLCGNVRVDHNVLIGAGAIIKPGIQIGEGAVIGAGSLVLRDVMDWEKVHGVVK
ncbi:acetyltransferase [Litoribacter ruber]|uniref:Acetyltransferase n=1 Tax=Litoribacter ruber TaxID=702568 RepID=A0AAP2CIK2_9BACT|nr:MULTISPECIES: acetyltransferase [Litoribacter]MBS9524837.1 acetyltransferase [Litoribacter alkaliphilus]MBT0812580.1 acetyltransferase [Litoribacter ruber]